MIIPSNQKEPGVIEVEPAERPSMDHCSSLKKMWRRVPMISRRAFSSMAPSTPLCSVIQAPLWLLSGPYRQDEGSRLHITPEPSITGCADFECHLTLFVATKPVFVDHHRAASSASGLCVGVNVRRRIVERCLQLVPGPNLILTCGVGEDEEFVDEAVCGQSIA